MTPTLTQGAVQFRDPLDALTSKNALLCTDCTTCAVIALERRIHGPFTP